MSKLDPDPTILTALLGPANVRKRPHSGQMDVQSDSLALVYKVHPRLTQCPLKYNVSTPSEGLHINKINAACPKFRIRQQWVQGCRWAIAQEFCRLLGMQILLWLRV